jgi:hypothetical protein
MPRVCFMSGSYNDYPNIVYTRSRFCFNRWKALHFFNFTIASAIINRREKVYSPSCWCGENFCLAWRAHILLRTVSQGLRNNNGDCSCLPLWSAPCHIAYAPQHPSILSSIFQIFLEYTRTFRCIVRLYCKYSVTSMLSYKITLSGTYSIFFLFQLLWKVMKITGEILAKKRLVKVFIYSESDFS